LAFYLQGFLQHTAFLIDALHELGRDGNDEAIQKALIFVSRCQNLESEYNTTKFAAANQDGGFIYSVSEEEGGSLAGQTAQGGLRSYGTMTDAGPKSMIYAGVTKDDKRVPILKTIKASNTIGESKSSKNLPSGKKRMVHWSIQIGSGWSQILIW
jgi:hypothetical protein